VLSTNRLGIVPYYGWVSKFPEWINDPEVVKYSELRHRAHAPIVGGDNRSSERWTILARNMALDEIGRLGVTYDHPNGTADLSIMIGDRDYWGVGYGTEAWSLMLEFLLRRSRKVTAGTMSVNEGMLRIFEKSGMGIEGVKKRQFLFEGREVDLVLACKFA